MAGWRRGLLGLVCVCSSAAVGCAPKPKPNYHITVRCESEPGLPLAGVKLHVQGKQLAESAANGLASAELVGTAGDVQQVELTCPEGYRSPEAPLSVLLRPLDEHGKRPEFHVSCPPVLRRLVVAVRAIRGPDLPLFYLGREIARTDRHGAAHALLMAAPGDTLSLTLDTSAPEHAQMMPQRPELRLTMPEHDDLVVFDQTFTLPKPKPKPRKPPPDLPILPQRI